MKRTRFLLAFGLLAVSSLTASAQRGTTDASLSMNQANGITSASHVVVEDYLNYHTHRIPAPRAGEAVAMELRWGNPLITRTERDAVLQVGLATNEVTDLSRMQPVNVCVVVDKSGSMMGDSKLEKVKAALRVFFKSFREQDVVSIVAYDSEASVLLPAQRYSDPRRVEQLIDGLSPGSSTNLHAGMMLGYQEALKHAGEMPVSRVILLTDGIANQGVTDPEEIARHSREYARRGIEISTIGVGNDLNFMLLRQIAQEGRGLNHFVGGEGLGQAEIEKVFRDEVESLLSLIGRDVELEIRYPAALRVKEFVGYAPTYEQQVVRVRLNNISSGLTQVVLVRFSADNPAAVQGAVTVRLRYLDAITRQTRTLESRARLAYEPGEQAHDLLADAEVKKNYLIGYMARALRQSATEAEQRDVPAARRTLDDCLAYVQHQVPYLKDRDLARVAAIVDRQRTGMVQR